MNERRVFLPNILLFIKVMISSGLLFSFMQTSPVHAEAEAVLFNIKPPSFKQYSLPNRLHYNTGYSNFDTNFRQKGPLYLRTPSIPVSDVFQIKASDAIDHQKYSQPDVSYHLLNLNSGVKVPSETHPNHKSSAQNPSPTNLHEHAFSSLHSSGKNSLKPLRDIRYLDSESNDEAHLNRASGVANYKLENKIKESEKGDTNTTSSYMQTKNNSTSSSDDLVSDSSDTILNYEANFNASISKNNSVRQTLDIFKDVPSLNSSNINSSTLSSITKTGLTEYVTHNSVTLNTIVNNDYMNYTHFPENATSPSLFPSINNEDNNTNSLASTDFEKKLSSGTVAGIVIAVLVSVTLLSSAVIYLLYRRFNGRCTSVVEGKFNGDNCGYLDDSLRSSIYLNNHIELPKESSEEMTSLDNDSFLNSLETMTIQNYWADNSKNTKV